MTHVPWLAAYIYQGEPWTELLAQSVKPLVEKILSKGLADGYFFIRYWERGPHVRLRFRGDTEKMEREIKPIIDAHFREWFKSHPSEREIYDWAKDLPKEQQWLPNDSVQYIPYEPEYERYGGTGAGIVISEKQFQASSDAILQIISETEDWGYDRALGVAIQMHLGFAFAMGMDLHELKAFYNRISYAWLSRAYSFDDGTTREEHEARREEARKAFAEPFEQQREMLEPFCKMLWEAFNDDVEFDQEWINKWVREMQDIQRQLHDRADELEFPQSGIFQADDQVPEARRRFWPILESYIHMTNNRLGILNRDEAFLGYLIEKSMDRL